MVKHCLECGQEVKEKRDYCEKCWKKNSKKGLGGWLVVWQIILILGIVSEIFVLAKESGSLFNSFVGIIAWLFFVADILLAIFTLYLMYMKSSKFRMYTLVFIWLDFIATPLQWAVNPLVGVHTPVWNGVSSLLITLVGGIVLTWYFLESKRVKNTFVK